MSLSNVRKYLFSSSSLLAIFGIILILIAGAINVSTEKPILELSKQETALNINNDVLIFMSAGNKRLLTDLLWVQTLLESDTDHYQNRDLNSWMFLRFNSISILDPMFYENYLYGGQFLAIVKDDLEGASIIYDKGLIYYPDDFSLNYNAGFLYYFEMGKFSEGLKYLLKIQDHGRAPIFLKSIINKLKLELGANLEEVFELVKINFLNAKDETLKKKLHGDLFRIRTELDLKCLNENGKNCQKKDLFGNDYIYLNGKFSSGIQFTPYKIKSRGN